MLLPGALSLLFLLLPRTWGTELIRFPLLYHFTAVSNPPPGTPAFWATGWLGPQQYLTYSNKRPQAEPLGAWVWESQMAWYWEKETADMRTKEHLFLEALQALERESGDQGKGANFTLQGLLGCALAPDNSSLPTALFALNGEEFMQFNPQTGNWTGEWPETETVGNLWMKKPEVARAESEFLLVSCPERLLDHLERGRAYLTWKEPPSMRLKAQPGSPGSSMLTCTAFSFYPPELKLSFLRNGLSVGTGEVDFGPNGDSSFHASSVLEIKSGDEHHYQCHVEHAGLPQPLFVELDSRARSSMPVVGIILGLLVVLVVTAGGVSLWMRMRSGLPAPWLSLSGDDIGDLLPGPSSPREAEPQDASALPATA